MEASAATMNKIEAIVRYERLQPIQDALDEIGAAHGPPSAPSPTGAGRGGGRPAGGAGWWYS